MDAVSLILVVVILVYSAILHEIMHGYAAEKLGDPTARLSGRLTLNPIPHIDPVMSIVVPALLFFAGGIIFGAAKPVPVNPLMLREGRKDLALVALAGPITNIAIAVVAAILSHLVPGSQSFLQSVLLLIVRLNLLLGIINLIPIPPLDGSKFFSIALPEHMAYQYLSLEPYGLYILFILLFFPIGNFSFGYLISQLLQAALKMLGV